MAIYSAFFGSTKKGVAECPHFTSHPQQTEPAVNSDTFIKYKEFEECSSSYISEKIISKCSTLSNCEIEASREIFGHLSCSNNTRLHLKVVYACIPEDAFRSDSKLSSSSSSSLASSTRYRTPSGGAPGDTNLSASTTSDYTGYISEPRIPTEARLPHPYKTSSSSMSSPSPSSSSSANHSKGKYMY